MVSLPWFVCSSIFKFDSIRAHRYPGKSGMRLARYAALSVLILVAWNSGQAQQQAQQVVQTLHHHVRPAVLDGQAAAVGLLPPEQRLNLSIVLPLRNQAELSSLLGRLYDPASPDYRRFLSVDQFTEQFGPTAEDYEAVVSFVQANSMAVTDNSANRLVVPISGTVEQINKAFNLTMTIYRHPTEDRTFFSPDREPSLNLSVPVAHIDGLNNFSLPKSMLKVLQGVAFPADVMGSGPGGSYLGSDMRAAYYGGTTLTGIGQAVGVLEFGGYNLSDVNATFSNAGQSYSVPVNNVLLDGATGEPDEEYGDGEQVLDIVQAIGMAPGLSQVRVYIGQGLDDANIFNAMATENICKELSVSWGWYPDDPSTDDVFFEEFAAQGQSIFIASGDDGAFDIGVSPYLYPAEDAYVTTVGGTHLTTNGAGGDWVSETVWNSEGAGSGGGISLDGIPIPSWQAGIATTANGGSTTVRNEPDVAMEGDFDNYYCDLGYCANGAAGTSFAAPRWAAYTALVNQQAVEAGTAPSGGIGFINPAIYAIGTGSSYDTDFHDITSGDNLTDNQPVWFSATTGYDLTTGWGSANGQKLIDALAGPQVPGFWIASSSNTLNVTRGASGTATISVTNAGGFTGSVTLAVTSALPSGVTASWGTNPSTGTSVLTLTATSSAAPGTTQMTITGTSGSLTETTNITLSVHGPSFSLSASPASLSIGLSATGTSTITVNSLYGFTGNVSLAVTSGLPSGVTATWGTNPTSGTSVLTLTTSSTAAGGTANLTITGTSGTLTATTNLALTITAPGFTLFATQSSLGIGQGSFGSEYIYVNSLNGFTGSVNLAVTSTLPGGVTASWGTNPTSGSSLLTLTASTSATIGQYSLTITGTSGNLTATTTLSLGVYAPTFTLSASSVNIGQGSSGTSYVYVNSLYGFTGNVNLSVSGLPSGVTASLAPNPTNGNSTLMLMASSSASTGLHTVTITGTSGSLTATTTLSLGIYAPTFTLSASSVNIGQGTSSTSYIYESPQYGFNGSVSLSVSGLPSGVTASFVPNPTTGNSILTLAASSSATVGQSTVTVTGTSGSLSATTTFPLGVYAPTFTLSGPGTVSVGQGTTTTSYASVNPQYGFTGSVTLSVSGLPTGVTASFTANPTTGSSTLTLTASSSAPVGQYTATLTGTSGSLTKSTTFSVGIYVPTFTLSASNLNLGQGSSGTSYIYVSPEYGFTGSATLSVSGLPSGVTASFSPNPTSGSSTLTLTATSAAVVGQYSPTITGKFGSQTVTTTLPLEIYAPSFTLGAYGLSIGQGSSGTSNVYVYSQYGFTGNVNFSVSGLPSGVTASFVPNPTSGSSTLTFVASSSATVGQYNVTVTGTSGSLTATTTVALGIYAPGFTISTYGLAVSQGTFSTAYVYVSPQYGFTGNVTLSLSGLPSGVTASFTPNPTTGTSTLTLTASSSATIGQYNVTITGKSGNLTVTNTFSLGVYAPAFTLFVGSYQPIIGQGGSGSDYMFVESQYGFSGSVNMSVSGLPAGVTASFSPNSTTSSTTMTLNVSSSASVGSYTLTITGTSGSTTATTTVPLQIVAPTFALYAYGASIGQGTSTTTSVSVNPQYGFTGNVNLSVSGLPSGVTASFAPNPVAGITGSSTLTLTASTTASLGQYNITITGKSGTVTATTTLTLGVYVPSFTLSAYGLNMGQGTSSTSYVYVTPQNGFTGSVTLSASGLPSGVTASFAPNPVTGITGNTTLTLTASSTASLGQYNVTITGKSGAMTATTTLTLGVYVPSFTLYANSLNIGQGSSSTTYLYVTPQYGFPGSVTLSASALPSGVTASFSPNPTTGYTQITLTASSTASLGQYNVIITGTSGTQTATTTLTLGVYPQSFTLSTYGLNIGQASSGTATVFMYPQYGFTGSVAFSASGLPSGVTASFAPNPTTGNTQVTLTASSTATVGQYNMIITGKSGALTATTTLAVGVYPQSFTLSASSPSIGQGTSSTAYVYVYPQYGFTGNVTLSASGLPSGVTASFAPNPTTGTSTVTLTASNTATVGQFNVTITGTSGALTATTTLALGVYPQSFTLSASSPSIGQGTSGTGYVYVYPQYGFTGSVAFSASGLPSGVTASFAPNPTTGNTQVTLTASNTATVGQYNIIITGKSGALTATTTMALGVYPQSFTLSASSPSIGQGTSSTAYVYVYPQYGFAGNVTLSASGLPSGVTASFAPNPTTGTSTITLTASSSAVLGQFNVTITGTSGALTATTTLALGVYPQGFTLYANGLNIGQGTTNTTYIYVNPQYGFAGNVTLSASGLPSGVTASFSPNPTTGTSTISLTASSTATIGQYNIIITGKSGALTATTTLALGVYPQSFTLSAAGANIGQGSSGTSYINIYPQYGFSGSVNLAASGLPAGVTATFAPNPTSTDSSVMTLTASSSTSLGQYNITVTGTSGALTATTTPALGVYAQGFTLSAPSPSIGQGTSSTGYVYVYPQYGFTGNVTLSASGLPSGVTASFSPNPTTGTSTITLTASSTATVGQYNATITGTSGALTATTNLALGVYPQGFTLYANGLNIGQGTTNTTYIYLNPQYGFAGNVTLSASGLPSGVTASFTPNPTTGTSTVTLTASSSTSLGQYNITITGKSGALTATTNLALGVYPQSFTLSAAGANIGQGSSGTSSIYIYPQYGFSGSVNLAASGLPAGVTATFAPNPTSTDSSVLTLTASSNATVGNSTVTITGTSGALTATTLIAVSVSVTPVPAILLSPTPGLSTVLGTGNVAFQWTSGNEVTDYQLNLSAIAPGGSDLYLYKGTALTTTAPTLPANDGTVYARLYSKINGTWQYNDYVYTESGIPTPAALTTPTPGLSTILGTSSVTFQWTAGIAVTDYQLNLSAIAPGDSDLYLYKGTGTSANVPTMPSSGIEVYARLYSKINGAWQYFDYVYTESPIPTPATLTSPTPGLSTILGTGDVAFQWTSKTYITDYQLNVSAVAAGDSDLFTYKGTALTATAPTLPANGVKVYARLYSKINGTWQYNDYVYTESGIPTPAALTTPYPGTGTILGISDVVFNWTAGIAVTDYQLNLSAVAAGDSDLYLYKGTALTTTAPTLPANGAKVYARLYSKINGAWVYNDYVYTEQ